MKKCFSFFTFIVGILSFYACQSRITVILDNAERLLNTQPDSALCILESIPSSELRSEESNARYALLKSIAFDKNFIDLQSDSIIRIATSYYSQSGAGVNRMRAWYYDGVVLKNSGAYSSAIISLERAEQDALVLKDDYYIGLIYNKKAAIYNALLNMPAAINCEEKAIDAFLRAGKSEHVAFGLASLGIDWFNNDSFEKARTFLLEAKQKTDNPFLHVQVDLRLATISIELNEDPFHAISIFNRVPLQFYDLTDYGYRAIAHERIGQLDSADYWLEKDTLVRSGRRTEG